MEKLVVEVAENIFNDIPGFSDRRRTLPEKIIRLRKMSQESHVRRMKNAFRKKQMQGTSDLSISFSSCSVSSINKINSSPSTNINFRNSDKHCDGDKSENSSSNVSHFPAKNQNHNNRKKHSHTRFTHVNRFEKTDNLSAENNSVMSDTVLDMCCKKKSMIHPNCKINKMFDSEVNSYKPEVNSKTPEAQDFRKMNSKNDVKNDKNPTGSDELINTSSKGWRPFDNVMDSIHLNRLKMKKDKDNEDSLTRSLETFNLKDSKNTELDTKGPNTSKIPILKSRLSSVKKNKEDQSSKMIRIQKSDMKSTGNIKHSFKMNNVNDSLEDFKAKTPDRSLYKCSPSSFDCNPGENSSNISGFNYKNEEQSNTFNLSVSKWLQDSEAKAGKFNENSNVSQAKSLLVDLERSMENLNLRTPAKHKTEIVKTASSLTYSVKGSCSGSEESLDYYYETETGDEVVKIGNNGSDEHQTAWEEDSEADSAALQSGIEDKVISTPDNSNYKYSDAPDYPKTPYDLRYPRYYTRDYNDNLRKVEENSTQLKTPKKKVRKKSRNLTPKIKRGKKAKSSLSCKIQASKSKKA